MSNVYYRLEHYNHCSYITLSYEQYHVIRKTPKGVWISTPYMNKKGKKFILDNATKRFAYPTKEEALNSFIHRKSRYLSILRSRMEDAQSALEAAQEVKLNGMTDRAVIEVEALRFT
jgi:hypothetical protein